MNMELIKRTDPVAWFKLEMLHPLNPKLCRWNLRDLGKQIGAKVGVEYQLEYERAVVILKLKDRPKPVYIYKDINQFDPDDYRKTN